MFPWALHQYQRALFDFSMALRLESGLSQNEAGVADLVEVGGGAVQTIRLVQRPNVAALQVTEIISQKTSGTADIVVPFLGSATPGGFKGL